MRSVFAFAIALSLGTAVAQAQPKYLITDIGSIEPGADVIPEGINNRGQVAGWAAHGSPFYLRAFRTPPNGVLTPTAGNLGTLGGEFSYATAINDEGQVTGYSYGTGYPQHGFRTAPDAAINPATDDLGAGDGFAINSLGQVAGLFRPPGGQRAFRTSPNQPINPATDNLGTLGGGSSFALGINDAGQVTGYAAHSPLSGQSHAFRTAPSTSINPATDDLGTLGGPDSLGRAINSSGSVVGNSQTAGGLRRAFRTAPNAPINPATDDLGSFGGDSHAQSINSAGQVVGIAKTAAGELRAFVHTGGTLFDLNGAIPTGTQWTRLAAAYAINDVGQIAGYGFVAGDPKAHGFRLDPPVVAAGNLSSQVAASGLSKGEQQSLIASLDAALRSIQEGNVNAAANQLGAFVNKVEALLKTGLIDAAIAQEWIDAAKMLTGIIG